MLQLKVELNIKVGFHTKMSQSGCHIRLQKTSAEASNFNRRSKKHSETKEQGIREMMGGSSLTKGEAKWNRENYVLRSF
jgi:hypothetical protein